MQYRKTVSHTKYNAIIIITVSFVIRVHAAEGADKLGFFMPSEFQMVDLRR